MIMYYIGIDGGGTHSRLIAMDEHMREVGRHTGGSTNLSSNSYEQVLETVRRLLTAFNRLTNTSLSQCAGLCIGSAGIDTEESVAVMERLLKEAGLTCPVKVVNDAELILCAETRGEPGVAIISGTGSIGYAVGKDRKPDRSGGWGYLIDDGGSGYWIGMQAIRQALFAQDGRGPETLLTDKLKVRFGIKNIADILNYIYTQDFNKAQIAELALLVKSAAAEGDAVATDIERQAAIELHSLAKALITRNGLYQHKVVLSGSVLLLNEPVRHLLSALIRNDFPDAEITPIQEKPEIGAVYLAMKQRQAH